MWPGLHRERDHRAFLARRQRLHRFGRIAIPLLAVTWAAFGVSIFLRVPNLANPPHVAAALQAERYHQQDLLFMALLLPVITQILLWTVLAFLLIAAAWCRLEGKYLRLLEAAGDGGHGPEPGRGEDGTAESEGRDRAAP